MTEEPQTASTQTVEAIVRQRLSEALGGRRGMVEAAVPTVVFTVMWLTTKELRTAVVVAVAVAVLFLVVRVAQRSTVQFAVNALVGIGIGALFVTLAARGGASEEEQALAYFLPGILYNAGYAVVMVGTILAGWPLVGFMVGSVMGDPTAWHDDKQIVRLCSRLSWLLVLPCVVRVVAQGPIYLSGRSGALDPDTAVAVLAVLKIAMGWPLQVAALTAMVWLLGRNSTPIEPRAEAEPA